MINDTVKLMFEFIILLGGLTGFITVFLFRKQDRRIKEAEAKVSEATAQTSIVSNYETLLNRYEKTLEKNDKQLTDLETFHNTRYNFIEQQMKSNTAKLESLSKLNREMMPLLCYDTTCKVRRNKKL